MSLGMFKKFNHRRFDYKTRYYDADKEMLDAIVGKYDKEIDQTELSKRRISSGFSSKKTNKSLKTKHSRQANFRLFVIVVFLCYVTYLFLTSDKFFKILDSLT